MHQPQSMHQPQMAHQTMIEVPPKFYDVSMERLRYTSRKRLALYLDPPKETVATWKELCELMGFSYTELENFAMKDSPTEAIISAWSGLDAFSIGHLAELLTQLDRLDVIEEALRLMHQDVASAMAPPVRLPVQDPSVSSPESNQFYTVDDVCRQKVTYYDAFVLYHENDIRFVKLMANKLETEYGFKLFVKDRNEIPGMAQNTICAKLIHERCVRTIVIISKEFLKSGFCEWVLQYAHALSPGASKCNKIVPIRVEEVSQSQMPPILLPYTVSDYTKKLTLEWFWDKLVAALRFPIKADIQYTRQDDISMQFTPSNYSNVGAEHQEGKLVTRPPPIEEDAVSQPLVREREPGESSQRASSSASETSLDTSDGKKKKKGIGGFFRMGRRQ